MENAVPISTLGMGFLNFFHCMLNIKNPSLAECLGTRLYIFYVSSVHNFIKQEAMINTSTQTHMPMLAIPICGPKVPE